jgi:hypothetical protein
MKIGLKAQIYWLTTGVQAAWTGSTANGITAGPVGALALSRMTRVSDINQPFNKDVGDGTNRDSIFEQVTGTIIKGPISFSILFDPTADASHLAMWQAYCQSQITVPLLVLDDAVTNFTDNFGIWAGWEVLKFDKKQQVKDLHKTDITIQASIFSPILPQFVKLTAS